MASDNGRSDRYQGAIGHQVRTVYWHKLANWWLARGAMARAAYAEKRTAFVIARAVPREDSATAVYLAARWAMPSPRPLLRRLARCNAVLLEHVARAQHRGNWHLAAELEELLAITSDQLAQLEARLLAR
jgi:hypothetical protein